jgi:hypothetical protein
MPDGSFSYEAAKMTLVSVGSAESIISDASRVIIETNGRIL